MLAPLFKSPLFVLALSTMLPQSLLRGQDNPIVSVDQRYSGKDGPREVRSLLVTWEDSSRSRNLPVKIYYPLGGEEKLPVILFSHGLGGSREGYAYLGRNWASHGYVSVHLQHPGSDDSVWRGSLPAEVMNRMRQAARNPRAAQDRYQDIRFALDRLTALDRAAELDGEPNPLAGRLDVERIGMAGHSFGALTTLAAVGQLVGIPRTDVSDPRIRAAIPMSAPVTVWRETDYAGIRVPLMHMTGTLDDSPIGGTRAADRRIPFDRISQAEQYLIIFRDGDHMIFSGRSGMLGRLTVRTQDAEFQRLILAASLAFWDAYLRDDAEARRWLTDGGLKDRLGDRGTLERKSPSPAKE
ncbi:MAG: alpha/beta hydrolase family protein [Thermogutta sp.]